MTRARRALTLAILLVAALLIGGPRAIGAPTVTCRPGSGVDITERHITVIRIVIPDGPEPFVLGHYHEFVECVPQKLTDQLELEQRVGRGIHRHWEIRDENSHDMAKTKQGQTVIFKVEFLCPGPSWWRERMTWSASIAGDGTPHPAGHEPHWFPKDRGIKFRCAR